jgi:hypothetical protein
VQRHRRLGRLLLHVARRVRVVLERVGQLSLLEGLGATRLEVERLRLLARLV